MRYPFLALLFLLLTISAPLAAQSSPELVLEATIGSPLQGQLQWLDDERLLVRTSAETRLYEPATSSEAIYTIPDGGNFTLIDGEIVLDGQTWDSATGELLGEVELNSVANPVYENTDGTIRASVAEETNTVEIENSEATFQVPVPDEYKFGGMDFIPNSSNGLIRFSYNDDYGYSFFQLWNLETGTFINEIRPDWESISDMGFFQDGRRLLIASYSEGPYGGGASLGIWDTAAGQIVYTSYSNYSDILFSADGQFVFFEREEGVVIWGMEEIGVLREQASDYYYGPYDDFRLSPDGESILAIQIGAIKLWDISEIENGIIPAEPIKVIEGAFGTRLTFFPDEERFYSFNVSDEGARIYIWNFPSLEPVTELELDGTGWSYYFGLAFNEDGSLFGASNGEHSYIWNTSTWAEPFVLPAGLSRNPSWSQAAKWDDGQVTVYDVRNQTQQSITVIDDHRGSVIGINAEANWVAFRDEKVTIYNLLNDELLGEYSLTGQIELNPTNSLLLNENGLLGVIEVSDSESQITTLEREEIAGFYPRSTLISPDGRFVSQLSPFCYYEGGTHALWDAQTGDYIASQPTSACGPYYQTISPDGRLLITVWDGIIFALDLNQEEILVDEYGSYIPLGYYYRNGYSENLVPKFSPDSQYMALNISPCYPGSADCNAGNFVEILHLNTVPATPEEFAELVFSIPDATSAVFSPDSQFILTNQSLWSLAGTEIMSLPNQMAAFDPSGRWFVTYSDEELLLWDWEQVQTGTAEPVYRLPVEGVSKLEFNADGSLLYAQRAGDVLRLRVQVPQS